MDASVSILGSGRGEGGGGQDRGGAEEGQRGQKKGGSTQNKQVLDLEGWSERGGRQQMMAPGDRYEAVLVPRA